MIYLANPSSILDSLKFADGINLFLLHKDIKVLFKTVNEVLEKVNEWWMSNKHEESSNTGRIFTPYLIKSLKRKQKIRI